MTKRSLGSADGGGRCVLNARRGPMMAISFNSELNIETCLRIFFEVDDITIFVCVVHEKSSVTIVIEIDRKQSMIEGEDSDGDDANSSRC